MAPSLTRAMLIYNPTAGQLWSQFQPERVKEYLEKHDWKVDIQATQQVGGGTDLALQAVNEAYDIALVAGGDGTINEAIQGLVGSPVKLGILPVGTANVLARELKIPLNYQQALEYLPIARTIKMDVGKVNHHYFVLMAGIGFDAQVVTEVNSKIKNIAGAAAFYLSSVKTIMNHKPTRVKMTLIDEKGNKKTLSRSIMQIFISNAETYGTNFIIAEQARFDDGLLEVHVVNSKRLRDSIYSLALFAIKKHKEWVELEHYRITKMTIKSKTPCAIQVDGDPITYTPATISVVAGALNVLKPKIIE